MSKLKPIISSFEIDELNVIKANAEDMFDDISKASEIIDAKANNYFGILILIIVSSIGYIVNKFEKLDFTDLILHEAVILIVTSVISLREIHKMLLPRDYRLKGTQPEFHINYDNYGKDRLKDILKDSITTLQFNIDNNLEIQKERVERLKSAIDSIVNGITIAVLYMIGYSAINFLFSAL